MRTGVLISATVAALAASPAFSQTPPPSPPPAALPSVSDIAQNPGWQRMEYARNFDPGGGLTPADVLAVRRLTAQRYLAKSERRKAEALALAEAARAGATLPAAAAPSIREALKQDLAAWRDGLSVEYRTWKVERDRWLTEAQPLNAAQWAARRAEFFAWRDRWIAWHRGMSMARR